MNYAGYLPDDKYHKDILINSSFLGVEGTADYLVSAIQKKFNLQKREQEYEKSKSSGNADGMYMGQRRNFKGICWDQWFPEAARCMALMGL